MVALHVCFFLMSGGSAAEFRKALTSVAVIVLLSLQKFDLICFIKS